MSQIVEDMYPAEFVLPMKAELVDNGFTDLTTAAEVDQVVNANGTTMVVINSVCGCCLLYTSPSPRDGLLSRMPSSA